MDRNFPRTVATDVQMMLQEEMNWQGSVRKGPDQSKPGKSSRLRTVEGIIARQKVVQEHCCFIVSVHKLLIKSCNYTYYGIRLHYTLIQNFDLKFYYSAGKRDRGKKTPPGGGGRSPPTP